MTDDRTVVAGKSSAIGIGTELNQTYKVDALIGVGGMGEVFKGHNIQTSDPVAIKIVLPEFARDEMILELFRKEARILNHLSHDAIVRYYVFSIDKAIGRPYLAMEFVDGVSLAVRAKDRPLSAEEFAQLLKRLADGLHKAHEAGVIHRDMSPDNVILPNSLVANAKIIDFGIARSANVGGGTLLGGSFAGKYNYVSPEQLGLYGGDVTAKSDIYSLALVMVAAMRGKPLDMSGTQVDVIEKRRKVPDLSDIPKAQRGVLTAMLQPDPADRPASMAEVRDWQEKPASEAAKKKSSQSSTGKPEAVKRPSQTENLGSGSPPQSNALRNAAIAAGVIAVIAIGSLGGWIFVKGNAPTPTISAQSTQETPPETPKTSEQSPDVKPPETNTTAATTDQQQATAPAASVVINDAIPTQQPAQDEKQPNPPSKVDPQPPIQDIKASDSSAVQALANTTKLAAVEKFTHEFSAKNCLFANINSMSESSANITLFGSEAAAASYRENFKQTAGFDPNIKFNPILEDQCPLISALGKLKTGTSPISITVDKTEAEAQFPDKKIMGEDIAVNVTNIGNRNIYFLMTSSNGVVGNIIRASPDKIIMKPGQLSSRYAIQWPFDSSPGPKKETLPTLYVAIATTTPLININSQPLFDSQAMISDVLPEIAATPDAAIAIGYVKLLSP